jgi:hypothetical protein
VIRHPSGIEPHQLAENMGYHLGSAFVALWNGNLDTALDHLTRYDNQRAPLPAVHEHVFRMQTGSYRVIFSRPSPWCEPVRFAMAAICNMCASEHYSEKLRLCTRAIMSVKTAIEDDKCVGRGLEP